MPAPYQVATSTSNVALDYAPQQRIIKLCDGSLLTSRYDGTTKAILTQITNPSGTSPTMTDLTQTFSVTSATNVVASLFVLHNGTTSDDVWVVYGTNSTVAGIWVAHATYTASGSTWTWDNTGTAINTSSIYTIPSLVWTGSNLIVATRVGSFYVGISATTTKAGNTGWSAVAQLSSISNASSHFYPILLHDATNSCTIAVYSLQADHVVARVIPDASAPGTVANWSSEVTLSTATNIGVGAANLTATLDPANKNLHVAWCNSVTGSVNPYYCHSTYTTTSVTSGTPFSITGGSGTTATSPSIGLDGSGKVFLFWASAASGAAGDVSYVTIASPYTSASSVTNLSAASTNDNVFPHVPQQEAFTGYVPLVYQRSATSPYALLFDNTLTAGGGSTTINLSGTIPSGAGLSGTLTVPGAFAGTVTSGAGLTSVLAVTRPLSATLPSGAALAGTLTLGNAGTGIASLTVTTPTLSWSNSTTGAGSGPSTTVTSTDVTGSGWAVELISSYGGMPIAGWREVNANTQGAEQTSFSTTTSDGHIHWLEQSSGGQYAGSEDKAFTLTELAPVGSSFRRYYQTTFGPDLNGFNWSATACVYPGDPGLVAYRFDCTNPSASAKALAASDSMEVALIGGMQQNDATWVYTNGYYGTVGGANTQWPTASATGNPVAADPDYLYITPAVGGSTIIGQVTVKQKPVTAYSPAWASPQLSVLVNTSRLKAKVMGTQTSFPASTTSTAYFLTALRRNLTGTVAAAIAADYLAPGTPTTVAGQGSFTSFSLDEALYVFAANSASSLSATLDLSPTHVTVRYKPRLKLTGWSATNNTPQVTWGGVALTAGTDYTYLIDATNSVLYLQLYFDVVATGATTGQRNNAALVVSPAPLLLSGVIPSGATLAGTLPVSRPLVSTIHSSAALLSTSLVVSRALTLTLPSGGALSGTLTVSGPGLVLAGTIPSGATATASNLQITRPLRATLPSGVALSGTLAVTRPLSGAVTSGAMMSGTLGTVNTYSGVIPSGAHLSGTLTRVVALHSTVASDAACSLAHPAILRALAAVVRSGAALSATLTSTPPGTIFSLVCTLSDATLAALSSTDTPLISLTLADMQGA